MKSPSGLHDKGRKPIEILSEAVRGDKLPHAILFYGDDVSALEKDAFKLAGIILGCDPGKVLSHADFFSLKPAGKAREIRVASVRELIRSIQLSPTVALRKVALVTDADRFNQESANAFLKTLEEPPADTVLILLTSRFYDVLATIRSRTQNFRLPTELLPVQDKDWARWAEHYKSWIENILSSGRDNQFVAKMISQLYGLVAGFESIVSSLTDSAVKEQLTDEKMEGMTSEEKEAFEAGLYKSLRQRLLKELEEKTSAVARVFMKDGKANVILSYDSVVGDLEHMKGLLELNMKESAALEWFLLRSLRSWSQR